MLRGIMGKAGLLGRRVLEFGIYISLLLICRPGRMANERPGIEWQKLNVIFQGKN